MFFCKYKDILGVPNEGFHSIRIGKFALLDIIGTIIIGYLIPTTIFKYSDKTIIILSIIIMFIIGILSHLLFCINTPLNKIIIGEQNFPVNFNKSNIIENKYEKWI
jgi:hypothetical protein